MHPKQKKQLKQIFDLVFGSLAIKEIFDKAIIAFDSKAQIVLPAKYKGLRAKIVIYK